MRVINEDFVAGMLFNSIETSISKLDNNFNSTMQFKGTLFYFDVPASNIPMWDCGNFKDVFLENVCQIITDLFIEKYDSDFELSLRRPFPYMEEDIKISVRIERKNKHKEMTISEIEEQLGYKIKIINEKEV